MTTPAADTAVPVTEVVLPGRVDPTGLQVRRRSVPGPGAGQALIQVEATGISFAEQAMRRGRYYGQPPFPFVPGYDLVGTVTAAGPGTDRGLTGQRVAALTKVGGWSSQIVLPAASLVQVPDGVDPAAAETAAGARHTDAFRARLREDLGHVFGLLQDGVLTAHIAARYPLTEAAAAMQLAESRTVLGKVILQPQAGD